MESLLRNNNLILMEGSIIERLKRESEVEIHPLLMNASLIYDDIGRRQLSYIYDSYIEIAKEVNIPFLMMTPTWRANKERVHRSGIDVRINQDSVKFMKEIRDAEGDYKEKIKIGGMVGCKYDCYKPEEGLSVEDAEEFHSWQIDQLVDGGVDFLIAETLPNVNEALGIAHAMNRHKIPYVISFVLSREGNVLDGTPIYEAIQRIDRATGSSPIGYSVNCAFPTFLCAEKQPKELFDRLIAYQGNASSLDHCDLDNSEILQVDKISNWGDEMIKLNQKFGVKIVGGCCGTGIDHLRYIIKNRKKD